MDYTFRDKQLKCISQQDNLLSHCDINMCTLTVSRDKLGYIMQLPMPIQVCIAYANAVSAYWHAMEFGLLNRSMGMEIAGTLFITSFLVTGSVPEYYRHIYHTLVWILQLASLLGFVAPTEYVPSVHYSMDSVNSNQDGSRATAA